MCCCNRREPVYYSSMHCLNIRPPRSEGRRNLLRRCGMGRSGAPPAAKIYDKVSPWCDRKAGATLPGGYVSEGFLATLGGKVATEILRAVHLLHGIAKPRNEQLISFRNAFLQRFEGREVMLLDAWTRSPAFLGAANEATARFAGFRYSRRRNGAWGIQEKLLLRKLSDALESGSREIELTTADFEKVATNHRPPDAFSEAATMAASWRRLSRGVIAF